MKNFLRLLGFSFGLFALVNFVPLRAASSAGALLTHGPVVGAVTDSTARVFARTSDRAEVKVWYGQAADLSDVVESAPQQTTAEHDFTTIIPLTNLTATTLYYVDIVVDGVPQLSAPYPRFKTFPVPDTNVSFKFVMLTDFGEEGSSQPPVPRRASTFEQADADHPDLVIIGGDFGHANLNTLDDKRRQFKDLYSFQSPAGHYDTFISQILRKYPAAHMWDDHDFGKNNATKVYPYKQLSYQVLTEYFPTYELSPYGDWQKFTYGQADFFLLDSRSQRDRNGDPDGPLKSMLDGDELGAAGQLAWLKQGLENSTAVWKFIVTPVVFNPTLEKLDAWNGFQFERKRLVKFIRRHKISGVVLISGDSHIGALDDGTNSGFPEMLVPGPNLLHCATVSKPGTWSQGLYWTGKQKGVPCNGYGVVTVSTNPDRVLLQVKDQSGAEKLSLSVLH